VLARAPARVTVVVRPRVVTAVTPPPPPGIAPAPGMLTRVRGAVDAFEAGRMGLTDREGRRRWGRTLTFGAFQGFGHFVGLAGATARWSARPWFDIEIQFGGGGGFGWGMAGLLTLRVPWTYRYSIGLMSGLGSAFTFVPADPHPMTGGHVWREVTPLWVPIALTHEWRTGVGFTYRLAVGIKVQVNYRGFGAEADAAATSAGRYAAEPEFAEAWRVHDRLEISDVLFDRIALDHRLFPVLPFVTFDIGWSL
jgi:hypothetical protein